MRIIAIATLVAASALVVSAASADQKSDKGTTAKPDDSSRIICKGGPAEADTGTRLPPKKTCHTKREWDEMAAQARQDLDQNMSHSTGTGNH